MSVVRQKNKVIITDADDETIEIPVSDHYVHVVSVIGTYTNDYGANPLPSVQLLSLADSVLQTLSMTVDASDTEVLKFVGLRGPFKVKVISSGEIGSIVTFSDITVEWISRITRKIVRGRELNSLTLGLS